MFSTDFWQWVDRQRRERGWTWRDLGIAGDINHSTVYNSAYGSRFPPTAKVCTALARAFDLPVESIMRRAGVLPYEHDSAAQINEVVQHLDEGARRIVLDTAQALMKGQGSNGQSSAACYRLNNQKECGEEKGE